MVYGHYMLVQAKCRASRRQCKGFFASLTVPVAALFVMEWALCNGEELVVKRSGGQVPLLKSSTMFS